MSRFRMQVLALMGTVVAFASAAGLAAAKPVVSAASHGPAAESAKAAKKKKEDKKATGPKLSVEGFGVNRLWVPHGKKITSEAECSEIVAGNGSPIGPPQEVLLTAYVLAENVGDDAPTRFKDELPDDGSGVEEPELSEPIAFSKLFEKPDKGVFFGAPTTSDKEVQKNTYHFTLESAFSQFGENEGPSAEEFDGTYSFTVSAEVGGKTLTSTGKIVVECPYLR
jgi:hypothetical protein